MAQSDYIKSVSVTDTVVNAIEGRTVAVNRSTISKLTTEDVEIHQSALWHISSENDALISHSCVGKVSGRIVKCQKGFSLYTKAEVLEGNQWFSLITNADNIQGTLKTVFTTKSALVFAGALLLGYKLLRRK
jgi:hypothetical protein